MLDASGLRQRLDKGDLPRRRPAVMTAADVDGNEGDDWFFLRWLHEPDWNIKKGV